MKKYYLVIIIFSVIAFSNFSVAFPNSITIVKGGNEYAPYDINLGNGKFTGIYVDVVYQVAEQLDIKVNFEVYPWARCFIMMKKGMADAFIAPYINNERSEYMYFSKEPLAYEENVLMTYKGSQVQFSGDVSALINLEVAALIGASYGEKWDSVNFSNKHLLPSLESLVMKLAKKRVEVIIGTRYVIQHIANKNSITNDIVALDPPLSVNGGYIAFSKAKGLSHKALSDAFSKALVSLKKTAKYQAILKKYLSE